METDQDNEIDVEVWLQFLLAVSGDKERREELVRRISVNTGQIPENVEKILSATIDFLANRARSN